jgi:hypothetical protein
MKTLSELVDKSVKKTAFFVIVLSSNMKKSFQSIYVGHTLTAIMIVYFGDICGLVDHHCLSFLFISRENLE